MEYLTENLLQKNLTREAGNGVANINLMYVLTPNEFFIYTYLYNAPKDFSPTQEKFANLLSTVSTSTVSRVVNRLKDFNLLSIDKVGQFYVWTVFDTHIDIKDRKFEALNDNEIKPPTPPLSDRRLIEEQIASLEAQLQLGSFPEGQAHIVLDKIMDLKIKLKNRKGN